MSSQFVRDYPEVASEFLKTHSKLQSTTSDLEESRQANEALCAEVARLQEEALAAQSGEVKDLTEVLARERDANKCLSGEIADLRALLDGYDDGRGGMSMKRSSSDDAECQCEARGELVALQVNFSEVQNRLGHQVSAYNDMRERVVELELEAKALEEMGEARRQHIEDLEDASKSKQRQCDGLQRRFTELEQQFAQAKGDLHEQKEASQAREQQLCQERDKLQKENLKLRELLKQEQYKHEKYKNKAIYLEQTLQDGSTRDPRHADPNAPPAPPLALLPVKSAESSHFEQTNLFASTAGQTAIHKAWRTTVEQMLRRPCLPLGDASAPLHLPEHINALLSAKVLSCPNRIVLPPSSDGFARLLSPVARCKGAAAPTERGEPLHELAPLLHTRREVFYQAAHGTCYIGTYACVAIGDVAPAEYAALPHAVQGALVRQTFPCKQDFAAPPRAAFERVHALYAAGAFRAQALALRCVGFNQPLADALYALRAVEGPPAPSGGGPSTDSRANASEKGLEKAGVPAPLPKEMPPTPPADGEASKTLQAWGIAPAAANKIDRRVFKSPSVMRRTKFQAAGDAELCAAPMRGGAKRPAGAAPEGTRVEVKRVRVLVQKRE